MKPIQEIVRVVEPAFLVNSAKHACRYETQDGKPLAPGYYFALWPVKAMAQIYNRDVRYFGPFATRDEAQHWQSRAAESQFLDRLKTQGNKDGRYSVGTHNVELDRAARDARYLPQQAATAIAGDSRGR